MRQNGLSCMGTTVRTSFIQRLPFARRMFRSYLGLMPIAIQQLDLSGYDLVISSNHAVAKGVLTGPDQMQSATCTRRCVMPGTCSINISARPHGAWPEGNVCAMAARAAASVGCRQRPSSRSFRRELGLYRAADQKGLSPRGDGDLSAGGYRRISSLRSDKEDFYLLACRFVPYKRAEVVVESFARQPGRRLVVVGRRAGEPIRCARPRGARQTFEFVGNRLAAELIDLMQRARGFVFAAEEDFGITLVEAQACGTPVIAYRAGRGGRNRDYGDERQNSDGVLFDRQEADAITAAVEQLRGAWTAD